MQQIPHYQGNVTELSDKQVFVYGANPQGFNGAGSAGFASFGVPGNRWREFDYGSKPHGWKGRWNEKGKTGPMTGTHGKSYGLITVAKAGEKRSITPEQLKKHISEFYDYAKKNPDLEFLVAQSHQTGLNGYSGPEMAKFFATAQTNIPTNIKFQQEFAKLIEKELSSPEIW